MVLVKKKKKKKKKKEKQKTSVITWFGLVRFYGITTIVGYLLPNPISISAQFKLSKQLNFKQFSLA